MAANSTASMSLDNYLKDIGRVPLLTEDEEIVLGNRVQNMIKILRENNLSEDISQNNFASFVKNLQTREKQVVEKGLKARDRLISANMRLVAAVANKARSMCSHLLIEDLMQEGAIGLARAAEKFDPARGYKFSTYAYWWIRQGITRAWENQENTIRLPGCIQKMARLIERARADLSKTLNREPTILQIAEKMGEKPERIKKIILQNITVISLDRDFDFETGPSVSLLDILGYCHTSLVQEEEPGSMEEPCRMGDLATTIVNALPGQDQQLIKQRHGMGERQLTVKEIAEKNGVSQRRIKDRYEEILGRMRFTAKVFAPEVFTKAKLS